MDAFCSGGGDASVAAGAGDHAACPVEARAAAITLASDTTRPKPVYRKSAPRGATYQGYPCSQTRKTGYVLHNGCWYPREVIRNGRLVVPRGQ
ncbi:MAG: hypothetical protein K0M49_08765 [Arenimonas sp.]|nr:hypothetical protein [Rhizobium sp.]MBW8445710.1 hypothetical protein [Arenimonas sp.]